jgi:hypothetical protein
MRMIDVEFSYWPFLLRNNEIETGEKGSDKAKHADQVSVATTNINPELLRH